MITGINNKWFIYFLQKSLFDTYYPCEISILNQLQNIFVTLFCDIF